MRIIRNKALLLLVASLVVGVFVFTGCAQQGEQQKTANLVYVNWAEGIAYTHLAEVVLEEKMGYDVTITSADVAPAYTSVANGDNDAFMESWLPVLHKNYMDKYQEDLTDLGHVYKGTQSGLVVPSYVTIDSINQLNSVADRFNGKITGIDAGAGIMGTTEQVVEQYNLDLELISSSGPAMTAALKSAVDNEEWIVVTGWKPHWMFGRWDLKFLKQDADKMMWKAGNIHIMGRADIKQDKPELAQFLSNMFFTDAELADLMVAVEESDQDVGVVAQQWMQENEDVIKDWIPEGAQTAMAE